MKTTITILSIILFFSCAVDNKTVISGKKIDKKEVVDSSENSFDNRFYPTIAMQIFANAELYRISGDYAGAILEYQEALNYDTNSVTIYNSIGDAYLNIYKYSNAIDYYEKSLRLNPNQNILKNKLADIHFVIGNVKTSILLWKEIIKEDPDYFDVYYSLINAYLVQKDTLNAKNILSKYQQKSKNDISILNNVVILQKKLGNFDEAIVITEKLIKLTNDNKYYDLLIELLFLDNQEYKIDSVVDDWIRTDSLELTPYYYKINNYIDNGKIDSAKKYLDRIDSRWEERWWISNFQALISIEDNLQDSVDFYYKRAFNFENSPSILYYDYSFWLLENRRYEDGIEVIDLALEKFPDNKNLKYVRALIYSESGELQKAIQLFEMLLSDNNNNSAILHNLALLYEQNAQYEKSNDAYETIISIDKNDAVAYNNYSYSLAERGENLQKALRMSEKTLKIDPNNGVYYDTMAWILFKMGDYSKALKFIDRAIGLENNHNPELFYHKGEILFELNRSEESKKFFKLALEIDPAFSLAKKRLEDINK